FSHAQSPRTLKLGAAEEWDIRTDNIRDPGQPPPSFPHPFHIHVFPFEVVSLKDEKGEEKLPAHNGKPEAVGKDTLLVPNGYRATVRFRYTRFDGKSVLHCHILDHEDQGMMEVIEVIP